MVMAIMMMWKGQGKPDSPATTIAITCNGEAFEPLSSSYRKLCNISLSMMRVVLAGVICISHLEGWSLEEYLSSHWWEGFEFKNSREELTMTCLHDLTTILLSPLALAQDQSSPFLWGSCPASHSTPKAVKSSRQTVGTLGDWGSIISEETDDRI